MFSEHTYRPSLSKTATTWPGDLSAKRSLCSDVAGDLPLVLVIIICSPLLHFELTAWSRLSQIMLTDGAVRRPAPMR